MITPDVREAVLRRDGHRCRIAGHRITPAGVWDDLQIAHVLFGDRKGKRDSKAVMDWVDEPPNLAAICRRCHEKRKDKGRVAREAHVKRMFRVDPEGIMEWYKRKPPKIRDTEVRLLIAREIANLYEKERSVR